MKALLGAGAAVEAALADGRTALRLAADGGHGEVLHCLVAAGGDLETLDHDGHTPLMQVLVPKGWVSRGGRRGCKRSHKVSELVR